MSCTTPPPLLLSLLMLAATCSPGRRSEVIECGPGPEQDARIEAQAEPREPVEVEARVAVIHPSPGVWCGILATFQEVEVDVLGAERERGPSGRITVRCGLVGPPMTEKDDPVVAAALFQVGNRLRFELEPDRPGRWIAWAAPTLLERASPR